MAPSGRRPKPQGQAVTRHQRAHGGTDVPNEPFAGPKLAPRRAGKEWPEGIAARWAAWSSMPHCRLWSDSDWQFAADALELAAVFVETGHLPTAAELRLRERVMGTTYDARMTMRIRYVDPVVGPSAAVVALDDFREL